MNVWLGCLENHTQEILPNYSKVDHLKYELDSWLVLRMNRCFLIYPERPLFLSYLDPTLCAVFHDMATCECSDICWSIKSIVQINSPKQRSGIIWTPFQVWIGKPQHEMMERKGFHTRNPKAHHTWSTSLSLRKSGCKRLLSNGRAWIEPRVQWRRTEAFKTSNNAEQKIFVSQKESDRENEWQTTASQTTQTKAKCQKEGKRARDFWRFYVWYGDPASDLNWLC